MHRWGLLQGPGGGSAAGPEAVQALMASDSNVFMGPQWIQSSGRLGYLHLLNQTHKLCPEFVLNGISVFEECMREKRGSKKMGLLCQSGTVPKGPGPFSSAAPSVQARVQAFIYLENCTDIWPNHKKCLRASLPRGEEIMDDKSFAWWLGGGTTHCTLRVC